MADRLGREMRLPGDAAGIADDRRRRLQPARRDLQHHHRALAEADQREVGIGKPMRRELGIEKGVELRRRGAGARPVLVRIAHGQAEPLVARRIPVAGIRRVRRDEGGIGKERRPLPPDLDEIGPVRSDAMQQHDQFPGGTTGERGDAGAVEHGLAFRFLCRIAFILDGFASPGQQPIGPRSGGRDGRQS